MFSSKFSLDIAAALVAVWWKPSLAVCPAEDINDCAALPQLEEPLEIEHDTESLLQQHVSRSASIGVASSIGSGIENHTRSILCLGDSITMGTFPLVYPLHLQQLLGPNFEVVNLGDSGSRVRKKRGQQGYDMYNHHYLKGPVSEMVLEKVQHADAVVIMLGTIDGVIHQSRANQLNYTQHQEEFKSDYVELVKMLQNSTSQSKVYLAIPPPLYPPQLNLPWWSNDFVNTKLQLKIPQVAEITGAKVIDCRSSFTTQCPVFNKTCPLMLSDGLHPAEGGVTLVAKSVFSELRKDFTVA